VTGRPTDVAARRPIAFLAVASGGFLLQTATVTFLTHVSSIAPEVATAIAVEIAVLHNFFWHERWTWADRAAAQSRLRRFGGYQLATGSTSLAGTLVVVSMAMRLFAIDVTTANVIAVVVMSVANYTIADRWIFPRTAVAVVIALAALPSSAAAQPTSDTLAAWEAHIARLERGTAAVRTAPIESGAPQGRELRIPAGLIHEWSGSVTIPHITVSQLVEALTTPGTPPPQEDVLESRLLAKSGDTLRVYLKLQRTAIITVIYDTEHAVTFERHGPALATSRSVATSIREAGGGDRGFLWRLNSYWTYRQIGSAVQVEVLSVSLSRDVPLVARALVSPIATRIARESLRRTLDAMRQFGVAIRSRARDAPAMLR
jgi:putative flippase GtrA